MRCNCKYFFYFTLITIFLLYGCPSEKKLRYVPITDKSLIVENSSSYTGVGPIPEWVLNLKDSAEIQKSRDGVFFIVLVEYNNYMVDINPKGELFAYLSSYLPDAKKVVDILQLEIDGKYWHKLKSGKYQIFYRCRITDESISRLKAISGELSEKSRKFISQL
ncbi:MAG: hypothetical protein ACPL4C_03600 [Brevinematia bacterium]